MEFIVRINDAIVSQGLNTFERIAQLHYGVEVQKAKHYSEIQSQQVAQDGVQMLSDLFKQFLNQMHGSNIIDALMKFDEIIPNPESSHLIEYKEIEPGLYYRFMGEYNHRL